MKIKEIHSNHDSVESYLMELTESLNLIQTKLRDALATIQLLPLRDEGSEIETMLYILVRQAEFGSEDAARACSSINNHLPFLKEEHDNDPLQSPVGLTIH